MNILLLDIDWSFFDTEYMGEPVASYCWFAGIILATILLKKPVASLITKVSTFIAGRFSLTQHKNTIHSMVRSPLEKLLQTILYFVAITQISNVLDRFSIHLHTGKKNEINIPISQILDTVFLFLFIIFLTQVVSRIIDFIYYLRIDKASHEENKARIQLLPLIKEMAKLFLWVLSTFWILGSVFHVNIPALVTGLGIGGVAIALAGKETVENLFAAFTILSDKPFQTGDIIKLGEFEGTVERIGFRSTRLRNSDGSASIIPNQKLVGENLINLSNRDTRGLKVIANLRYGITHEALQQLISDLKEMLENTKPVTDPIEVNVETFDKETFQLVVSYHLPNPLPAGAKLNDVKHMVSLKIFEIVTKVVPMGTVTAS